MSYEVFIPKPVQKQLDNLPEQVRDHRTFRSTDYLIFSQKGERYGKTNRIY
jgi:mRNA-degrading endonuclease RelE of RelBE toxin-antitoxin system